MDLGSQLSALVLDLRQPSSDSGQRQDKLKKIAYYLPQVKNPQNLWLVLNELALSPGLLSLNRTADLPVIEFAVDAISFAANRKARVSDPTLTYAEWEATLVSLAYKLPPLFGLIVISGLCARGSLVEQHLPRFIQSVAPDSSAGELVLLAAACLTRAQWSERAQATVYDHLDPPCRSALLASLLAYVYSPDAITLQHPSISVGFGGYSRTISKLLEFSVFHELMNYLQNLQIFIRTAISLDPAMDLAKKLAFGVTIQLEGLMAQVVRNGRIRKQSRAVSVCNVLQVLQPMGYVFEAVGSQFSSYQFVFNACLDTLQSVAPAERIEVLRVLGEHWAFGQLVTSDVRAGDLLFFFETSEPMMPLLFAPDAEFFVLHIAQRFLDPIPDSQSQLTLGPAVFEAAHSVMLAYLATHPTRRFDMSRTALQYFERIMPLFPEYLSARQLRTAVEAIMKATSQDKVPFILQRIFELAKMAIPGMVIPAKDGEKSPPTLRSALVSTLLHGVAQYSSASDMAMWLHRIGSMVPEPYSPGTQQEREFLIQDFKDVVTSLGDYSGIGIKWFFGEGWSRL